MSTNKCPKNHYHLTPIGLQKPAQIPFPSRVPAFLPSGDPALDVVEHNCRLVN